MIPLTFLYDEYIDWPKLSEQKKYPFEYIVPPPPPTSGVGTITDGGRIAFKRREWRGCCAHYGNT